MSSNDSKNVTVQLGSGWGIFAGLLTILFIGLKLTGYIAWSWIWVLSPLWIYFGLIVAVVVVVLVITLIALLVVSIADAVDSHKRQKAFKERLKKSNLRR